MKTLTISTLTAGLVLLAFTANPARGQTNMTVSGNLQVSGTVDFLNNTMMFGSLSGTNPQPGIAFSFTGVSGTNPAVFAMTAGGTSQSWLWSQQSSGSSVPMMRLDNFNVLNFFSTSNYSSPVIVIDPNNARITINGHPIGDSGGFWYSNGSNTALTSGSLGIGTSSPQYLLDVNGTGRIPQLQGSDSQRYLDMQDGGGGLLWYSDAGDASYDVITSGGVACMGVRTGEGAFVQYAGGLSCFRIEQSGGGLGLMDAAGIWINDGNGSGNSLSVNGNADFSGYVGIGNPYPAYNVDVDGDVNVTGDYYSNGVPLLAHVEPQGDLDMGEFTYDPNSGGGGGGGSDMMSGGAFGGGGGSGMGRIGGGTAPGGGATLTGTTTSGTASH